VVGLVLVFMTPAAAQDALRGKRLYLDTARVTGATVSCVDCHRALPPGSFGIGRAANNPAIVANALNAIPQMTPLRGRLTATDITDLAAYIGNPSVPSPVLKVSTRAPSGAESIDRIDFGAIPTGQSSARGVVRLTNDGALALVLSSNVRIVGPHAAEYKLADSRCTTAALGPAQSCEIGITFRPVAGGAGLRSGAAQIDHD
jgi:cytochrome c553